jgi:hypothetical protein
MASRDDERLETIMQMVSDLERRLETFTYEQFVDDGDERDLTAYRLAVIGENGAKPSATSSAMNIAPSRRASCGTPRPKNEGFREADVSENGFGWATDLTSDSLEARAF